MFIFIFLIDLKMNGGRVILSLKDFLAAGEGREMKREKGEVKKKVRPVRWRTKKTKKQQMSYTSIF